MAPTSQITQRPDGNWVPEHNAEIFFSEEHNKVPFLCGLKAAGKRRRGITIDGGAYVGTWTRRVAEAFQQVIAFEPDPVNYSCLIRNIKQPNVICYHAALSDEAGFVNLAREHTRPYSWQVKKTEGGTIPAMTIDDLKLSGLDLIKLDLEGHEYEALMGGLKTIVRYKPAVVLEDKHDLEKRATKLLESLGMQIVAQKKHDYVFSWEG